MKELIKKVLTLFGKILRLCGFNDTYEADDTVHVNAHSESSGPQRYCDVKPGDIIVARMPLKQDVMNRIEKNHRLRPYIVASKHKDYVVAYSGSSKKKRCFIDYFYLSKNKYNVWKDGYIDLSEPQKIPKGHIHSILDSLTLNDIIETNKIINNGYTRGNHPQIKTKINFPIGTILQRGKKMYYLYWIGEENAGIFKLIDTPTNIKLRFNHKKYYLNAGNLKIVDYTDRFIPVGYIGTRTGERLTAVRNKYTRIHGLPEDQSQQCQMHWVE